MPCYAMLWPCFGGSSNQQVLYSAIGMHFIQAFIEERPCYALFWCGHTMVGAASVIQCNNVQCTSFKQSPGRGRLSRRLIVYTGIIHNVMKQSATLIVFN